MKDYKKIPRIVLWVLMGLGIIASVMFFLPVYEGTTFMVAGDELQVPLYTNLFLTWIYVLIFLVCAVTLVVVIWEFIKTAQVDMKRAMNQLCIVLGFVVTAVWVSFVVMVPNGPVTEYVCEEAWTSDTTV